MKSRQWNADTYSVRSGNGKKFKLENVVRFRLLITLFVLGGGSSLLRRVLTIVRAGAAKIP